MKKRRTKTPAVRQPTTIVTPSADGGGLLSHALLQGIRDKASRDRASVLKRTEHERFNKSQMIAELEAVMDDITATIAFLRAERDRP